MFGGLSGAFEYLPNVRHRADLPTLVDDTLAGKCRDLLELDVRPGTLTLFNGFQSLHRVAPVVAPPSRLMLILSYDSAPDQQFDEEVRLRFFGRRKPILRKRHRTPRCIRCNRPSRRRLSPSLPSLCVHEDVRHVVARGRRLVPDVRLQGPDRQTM